VNILNDVIVKITMSKLAPNIRAMVLQN